MTDLLQLFWLFLKVNLLSTSGPASLGLLYQEVVGSLMSESQFVQAVSFSSILPGSDALQLAMYIGYVVRGLPGALTALLGSILPPTVVMLAAVSILHRLRREAWMSRFISGLTPAIAVLMVFVAWRLLTNGAQTAFNWQTLLLAGGSLLALVLKAPAPLVLLASGLLGVFLQL